MMRLVLLIACVLSFNVAEAQTGTELQILKHINNLSTDALKDRSAGTAAERIANKYLRESWGDGKRTSFYSWEYDLKNGTDSILVSSEMVGTFLYNKAKATILIGADLQNAADVAVLVGIQNRLSELKLDVNVMVVSVTSANNEHQGLDYLMTHMPKKAKDIRLVIYINGIGGMTAENSVLTVSATSGIYEELQLLTKQFELIKADESVLKTGETKNYMANGIQCLSVSTNLDESLNTKGLHQIQELLVDWVVTK